MTRCISAILIALGLPLVAAGAAAAAAPGPNCSRAASAAEKAICATPALAAADAEMVRAYTALKDQLPAARQNALVADQHGWIELRAGNCDAPPTGDLVACLLTETDRRRDFLLGQQADSPSGAPQLQRQAFVTHAIHADYPQIIHPSNTAQRKFNRTARDVALGEGRLVEYGGGSPPDEPGAAHKSYTAAYEITYLDRHLAAVEYTMYSFDGGAHPNWSRWSLVFDLAQGFTAYNGEYLADNALPGIGALCDKQLSARQDLGLEPATDGTVAEPIRDPMKWVVDRGGVDIIFDPDTIAPSAAGVLACRLSYAALKPFLKPGGLLPPSAGAATAK